MPKLIILRGNSGSGKTTIARMLQKKIGLNTMLISQDVVRRDILWVKDGPDTKALPLLKELLVYGRNNCEVVILEGILDSIWYKELFELAVQEFGSDIYAYYWDIPFEETLKRHSTRPKKDEFGEESMRKWWKEKDFLKIISEKVITEDMQPDETVNYIYEDMVI